jgi:uncharacterized repeat protein (TIGR03803 family)
VITALITLTVGTRAAAQTEEILHNFDGPFEAGGIYPNGGLIMDSAGNLYGTTANDSDDCTDSGCGTVFELVLGTDGDYTEKVLHTFSGSGKNAWGPEAGVVMDASGNLYGTTVFGGSSGSGAAFKLTLIDGVWKESVIHNFAAYESDGEQPVESVALDSAGSVFGATENGGSDHAGTIFEISPNGSGGYTEKTIHSFKNTDGAHPTGNVIIDSAGNLYTLTGIGGTIGEGTLIELSPTTSGSWTEAVLYDFSGSPGPYLTADASGNFYGVAGGGNTDESFVWKLSPATGGAYTEQVLYNICTETGCPIGYGPIGVVLDAAGNIYGTNYGGGAYTYGTAFELSPSVGGGYTATLLHSFGNGTDGAQPNGTLLYSGGVLYGATTYGGKHGGGTIFQVTP